jgi:hypothetical protein
MSDPDITPSDPRATPGDITGPGGPHDRNSVVLDTSNAVLLDYTEAALGHNGSDGRDFVALLLGGRINQTLDRARVLFLMDADGAAAIVTELESLMTRAGGAWSDEYHRCRAERSAAREREGW